jgi:hypothetical protein
MQNAYEAKASSNTITDIKKEAGIFSYHLGVSNHISIIFPMSTVLISSLSFAVYC